MKGGTVDTPAEQPAIDATAPLVVVSNRLPVTIRRGPEGMEVKRSSGGLVAALEPVLEKRGGTWIGWAGAHSVDALPDEASAAAPFALRSVPLDEADVEGHYHGFSNRTLWPLFHSLVSQTRFDRGDWEIYEEVNGRFAEAAADVAARDEMVWIHDYQLARMPLRLRQLRPDVNAAFFLHIPFPPYDVFRLLPWARYVMRGLLACGLVGFHTESYAHNFLRCAERLLGERVDHDTRLVEHGTRTVQVGVFPLGIDVAHFEGLARADDAPHERLPERYVLGVDRLDYTKGILERLRAFERFLELHPEQCGEVSLLQLAVPSRARVEEYQKLKQQVDQEVGRINGRFARADWAPIQYLYRSISPEHLASLYRHADVALVTPLRDGMNLVAKEYVACQVDDPGVLVLSRMAGAAETMREALLVNPYDLEGTADALHRALTMSEGERRTRMIALQGRERREDVHAWVEGFLEAGRAQERLLQPPSSGDLETWLGRRLSRDRVVLMLDYDGTLAPLRPHPREAVLDPRMRSALEACAGHPDVDVAVISGRALDEIQEMVGVDGVVYAGNHGLEIEGVGSEPFRHDDLTHYQGRTNEIAALLKEVAAAAEGAWVEEKGATLTFHVRQAPEEQQEGLTARAREIVLGAGFVARDAHRAVEARPPIPWDKGSAALHILRALHGPEWPLQAKVLYAGDDNTDEDAFRALSGLGITIRVGSADRKTAAVRHVPDPDALRVMLEWLARRPPRGV
jgi:trehalose 6-phosphate synthase/phosphatase